jgi:hypothetical protein
MERTPDKMSTIARRETRAGRRTVFRPERGAVSNPDAKPSDGGSVVVTHLEKCAVRKLIAEIG